MLIFLFLAFVAAFASFHLGKHRFGTPLLLNLAGAFYVWGAVFCLGGALAGSGPWAPVDESLDLSPYVSALKSLGYAVVAYGGGYLLQRAIAKMHGRKA